MKLQIVAFITALLMAAATSAHGQTLNWGSEVFSDLATSKGVALDNTFVFEIGSFDPAFVPTTSNVSDWSGNWRIFDRAAFDPGSGYFTSTVQMFREVSNPNTVHSDYPGAANINFSGLEAYLWVRNGTTPVKGTEWLLTRASNWTFPVVGGECCDKSTVEWSVSDLTASNIPKWGSQNGVDGPGVVSNPSSHTLQTFTFVPEPSSALLGVVTGCCMILRRRRTAP